MPANNFEEYNSRKEELLSLLEEAKVFYEEIGEEKISQSLAANMEVIRSGEFEVVIVGEFSAGKSTFLNALMREKYLPSYTKETTATINYLRHASESDCPGIVYYVDGREERLKTIDGDVIETYVCTKSKEMDVSKSVKHLDLFLDSPFLENHVTLIDSPGLNGMKQGLGDITDAQIKRSHAVIFMFSAEQPGKRSDFEYLKKIKDEVNTVFLVLNKIDCIKASENQTVEDTVETLIANYKREFPEDTLLPEIISIAAYPALAARSRKNLDYPPNRFNLSDEEKQYWEEFSRMKPFEDRLLHFLTNSEKTIMQIREPLSRLQSELLYTQKNLENEIRVIEGERSGVELDAQIIELQKVIEVLEEQIGEQRNDIRKKVKRVERDILDYLNTEVEKVKKRMINKIEEFDHIDMLKDDQAQLNSALSREMKVLVTNADERFRQDFFDQAQEQYIVVLDKLEDQMNVADGSSFTFDAKINVSAKNIDAGLAGFNAMMDDMKKEIVELEKCIQSADAKQVELIEMASKKEALEDRYNRIKESQEQLRNTFLPPEVRVTIKTGKREISRKGIQGFLEDIGILEKRKEEYSYEEKDDSARKAYIEDHERQKRQLTDKQNEIERKLEHFYGADKKLQKVEQDRIQLQAELENLRRREIEMTEKFNKDLNEKYEREIVRIKSSLKQQLEECLDDAIPNVKSALKQSRASYVKLLQDLLNQSISSQIELKKNECENLIRLREDANDHKEELLSEKGGHVSRVSKLIEKADAFMKKVDDIAIDKMEYQTI